MEQRTRVLVVMRHAKAEPSVTTDAERALTRRGVRDAGAAGAWLAASGVQADHALVSAALRTRQTWETVAGAAGWGVEASYDEGLHTAGPETTLDLVRAVPPDVSTLVVVGHNPTVSLLAQLLDSGEGDPGAADQMLMGFPTAAVALLAVRGPWADLGAGMAGVTGFHVARSD